MRKLIQRKTIAIQISFILQMFLTVVKNSEVKFTSDTMSENPLYL